MIDCIFGHTIREYDSTLYVGMSMGKNGQKYSLQKLKVAFLRKKLKLSHKNWKTASLPPILQLDMYKSYPTTHKTGELD